MSVLPNRKAVLPIVTFTPPAVENTQVQAAVAAGFHAAGAGGFQRAAWIVQPNVAARYHLARHVHVVILNEDQMAFQLAVFAEMNDALDIALAFVIARMGFAGKNELD